MLILHLLPGGSKTEGQSVTTQQGVCVCVCVCVCVWFPYCSYSLCVSCRGDGRGDIGGWRLSLAQRCDG